MKMRKFTAFIIAAVALVATFGFVPVAKEVGALPAVEFIQAYHEYSNEYIADCFGIDVEKEQKELDDGKAENTTVKLDYKFAYKHSDDADFPKNDSNEIIKYDVVGKKTTFNGKLGIYDIRFFKTVTTTEAGQEDVVIKVEDDEVFSLIARKDVEKDSIRYDTFGNDDATLKAEYGEYIKKLNEKLAKVKLGESLHFPELDNFISSDYFDYNSLTTQLYYAVPGATSFTKTSSKYFRISDVGTYSFYVLAKDPMDNELAIDVNAKMEGENDDKDLYVRKAYVEDAANNVYVEGWFKNVVVGGGIRQEFVAPIFTFDFSTIKEPEITVNSAEQGFIGLTYKDGKNCIKPVTENGQVKYELYYSASKVANPTVDTVKANATDISEDEEIKFNESSLHFTPNKKGCYYIVCTAADRFGSTSAVSNAIEVNDGFHEVKYETQFWKYNWVSMMFLGFAVLSLVGIIVIALSKPKNKAEKDVKEIKKK